MEFAEWNISLAFDDERQCQTVYVGLGHWKATGFYHEAGLSLTEEQVTELISDLRKASRRFTPCTRSVGDKPVA